jgi:hypothetical protein
MYFESVDSEISQVLKSITLWVLSEKRKSPSILPLTDISMSGKSGFEIGLLFTHLSASTNKASGKLESKLAMLLFKNVNFVRTSIVVNTLGMITGGRFMLLVYF